MKQGIYEQQIEQNNWLVKVQMDNLYMICQDFADEHGDNFIDDCEISDSMDDVKIFIESINNIDSLLHEIESERESINSGTQVYFDTPEEQYNIQNDRG